MNTILLLLVIFFANLIQGITGFAGTVLAMPVTILLVGLNDAKVILAFMATISCAMIVWQTKQDVCWREVGKITSFMLIGMAVGIFLCDFLSPELLLPLYGMIVIAVGAKNLLTKQQSDLPKWALLTVLLVAGIIHGMFLSGGTLLVIYATCVFTEKAQFRANLAPVWVILNGILLALYAMDGLITSYNLTIVGVSLIPLLIATWWGNRLQQKMNQQAFLKLTYVLLIVSGLSLL